MSKFEVMAERCDQCLFGADRIVDAARAREVLAETKADDSFFICHKASLAGERQVCCRGFYDTQETRVVQVARRLTAAGYDVVDFITEADLKS